MNKEPPSGTSSPAADAKPRTVAVIDVGATAIRMEIAELDAQGGVRIIDSLRQGVHLGKDTFTKGHIQQATIQECVEILRGFRRAMDEYGIAQPDQMRAVATSSVREADNRDTFLDRIYIATGINIRAIDEAEENRLTFMAAQGVAEKSPDLVQGDTLVADVGGGSTEVLLLRQGYVAFSNSYRVGSLRMRETLETYRAPTERVRTILGQNIQRLVEQILRSVPASKPSALIAMSAESRFAASQLVPEWPSVDFARIDYKTFSAFAEKLLPLSAEKIVARHRVTYQEAETLGPALLVYVHLARGFKVDTLVVPKAGLRDGLLKEMTLLGSWSGSFAEQVIHSAAALGEKYRVDEGHARHVANLALQIFRELKAEHQLGPRHELLLEVAGLVHEVGGYVSSRSHHKHSMYLILNSDLFGLTREDMAMIALVSRYHRRALPGPTHAEYNALDRDRRIAVSKMAAILRVADALDRNHVQQVRDLAFSREDRQFVITVRGVEDLTMERLAMKDKGNLFEEVYGMPVVLREARAQAGESSDAG